MSDYLFDRVKRLEDRVENLEQGGYGSHLIEQYLGEISVPKEGACYGIIQEFMSWLGKDYKVVRK